MARHVDADVPIVPDPPSFDEADVSDKPRWFRSMRPLTDKDLALIRTERLWSQRALLAVDEGVQEIMDTLAATGKLDDTLVVFMSDNSFSFGAHRYVRKYCAYESCSHVPLFIRHPDLVANRVEDRVVSNLDFASTVADFTGVPTRVPQDGRSLLPLLLDPAADFPDGVLLERLVGGEAKRFFGIRTQQYKYVEYANGDRELYDLGADPDEMENLVDDPAYDAIRADLETRLAALRPS